MSFLQNVVLEKCIFLIIFTIIFSCNSNTFRLLRLTQVSLSKTFRSKDESAKYFYKTHTILKITRKLQDFFL